MSNPPTSSVTDQQLVAQVLGGNTAAFGQVVQRTEGLVTQLVFKLIRHPADRPDIAQEVYLKVFKNLAGFKFQAKLSTWVGQITYNTCLHYLEKKQLVLLDPAESAPDDEAETIRAARFQESSEHVLWSKSRVEQRPEFDDQRGHLQWLILRRRDLR